VKGLELIATKQKILEVAVNLFSKKGFSGVSVREIARNVGIKESSLYNHYQNKDDILVKIFDYYETEIENATPTEDYLAERINSLPVHEFWEKGMRNFQKATQKPLMQKISKIVLLEMFQNERARDIAINELFTRQQKLVETVFNLMQKRNLVKQNLNPKFLATEYAYGLLGMQFEHNILSSWDLGTDEVRQKMFEHIKFISEYAKSPEVGEKE
jgi:AcrR family transcriptional regulator